MSAPAQPPTPRAAQRQLRAQQQALQQAIVGGTDAAPPGLLRPQPGGAPARLDVYRHAYRARLLAALRDHHEVLARVLGDEAFDALAADYIDAQPSRTPSIRWYGAGFAAALAARAAAGDARLPHPALVDLARMEAALREVFDAADAPPLGRADLAGLPPADWPALRLRLHPAVRRLALDWAVEPVWAALRAAAPGAEPELPAPAARPHTLLVWRAGLDTRWRSLADEEAALLARVADGQPFAALCAQAGDAAVAAQALAQWLADGLLAAPPARPGRRPAPG